MNNPEEIDAKNDFAGVEMASIDGAERETLERRLSTALRENAFLQKELAYRVRDSLQLMESLVKQQISATSDPGAIKALRATMWRLRALCISNCMYLDWRSSGEFELSAFMRELTVGLFELENSPSGGIGVELADTAGRMAADLLVPIGMITAEILTSIIGSRRDADGVRIGISWGERDDGAFRLRYHECGDGCSEDLFREPPDASGMEIVRALAEQADAVVAIENKGSGMEIRIDFPRPAGR